MTLIAAIVASILAVLTILRTRRWWLRPLPLLVLAPVVLGAWFARQNHFEWMFAPQTTIAHVDAAKATFVQPDDLVMAVARDGAAIAYPIRQLAYHHIANDTARRRAHRRHVLNALSHRSGVERGGRRQAADVPPGRHQQPELHHARRADGHLVAAGVAAWRFTGR